MEVDLSFIDSSCMEIATILVSIDLRDGLAIEFTLKKGSITLVQRLDYQGIPFRCFRCDA